ncbi:MULTISPECIES: amidase [unclassified Streptomyces]|uniref:amidase n=1 Tax=unclassified Streptomyces TaxID=2593676 RepID=UPI0016616F46|nr:MULTISPECIES: amidase [unclassified Streptomyces]MBD0711516.1 amidase [Streptomyces sp. CBMA291]MBD0716520.1 amidase [Streptomyces sp. CBMA370]
MPRPVHPEICDASASDLVRRLRSRELSAREVMTAHLERVEQLNPELNAIVTLTAEAALEGAAEADERLARGEPVGPLHGLPVAHKDTHNTKGLRTTHGSPVLADHLPEHDDISIERMRAAGAITLGKTNVPEFGAGSHTFNPLFGPTRNPYDTTRSAGGSSGGTAAALAAGLHPLGDGSDMGGSIRNPASFCNIVGLRPSPGRVPLWPDFTPWATQVVQGPMARTVTDVALLLSVMAGPDPRCPVSVDQDPSVFAAPLDGDVRSLRVAWSPDLGGVVPVEPVVAEAVEAAAGVFAGLGCSVVRDCPDLALADEVFRTLRGWQMATALGPLLEAHPDQVKRTLAENIAFGQRLTGADLGRAELLHGELFHRMRNFFTRYDVLLLPVSQLPPFPVEIEYPTEVAGTAMTDYLDWMRSAYSISATGSPALAVPAGFTPEGLPLGVQLVGPHRGELPLLRAGYAFEQATRYGERRPG